jgi:uncharacterized protein (DUF736 family)
MSTNATTTKSDGVSDMKRREVGALWKKESKSTGQKFLTGHVKFNEFGEEKLVKIIVFSNKNKKDNAKAPAFIIYLSREDGQTSAAPRAAESKDAPPPESTEESVL